MGARFGEIKRGGWCDREGVAPAPCLGGPPGGTSQKPPGVNSYSIVPRATLGRGVGRKEKRNVRGGSN